MRHKTSNLSGRLSIAPTRVLCYVSIPHWRTRMTHNRTTGVAAAALAGPYPVMGSTANEPPPARALLDSESILAGCGS